MKPTNRTSSQMTFMGVTLPGWSEVHNSDGSFAGSNQRVVGGTQHYDSHGNPSGFTDTSGNRYNPSGNLAPDYDPYDD